MFRFLFNLMVLILLLAGGGFLWFIFDVPKSGAAEKVDAVVVLTGENGRIERGLTELREERAKLIYISGLNSATTNAALQQSHNITPDELQCCVVTDKSESTRTNALETAKWVERNNIRTLRLVTSSFHMRRSLLEFRSLMPETVILPTPVSIAAANGEKWWKNKDVWEMLGEEYLKYIIVQLRQFEAVFIKD